MKRQGRSKIECDNYQIIDDVGKEVIITVPGWMRFRKPNVIIAFSNVYPDTGKLTSGRWLIFKVNREMQLEDVTEAKLKRKCGGGDANKNGNNTYMRQNYNESWEDL